MAENIKDAEDLVMILREFKIFHEPKRVNIQKRLKDKIEEFKYTELRYLINSKKTNYKVLYLFSEMAKFILSQE
jgi:hypothetical protein